VRDDMLAESRQFLGDLLANQGTVADLLTSRQTKIAPALGPVYGLNLTGTNVQSVMLPADQRSGILTEAGVISGWAKLNRSVHRGLFVFRELMCGVVPAPPAGVNVFPPAGIKTEREFAAYRAANTCHACHGNFDPLGLAFENYDDFGRYITQRDGAPVDARGTITIDDQPTNFANAVELGMLLADSPQVRACVAQKLTSYTFGRRPSDADTCIAQQAEPTQAATAGPQLLDLFKGLTDTTAFRNRSASN
jgi:hypothetical protein